MNSVNVGMDLPDDRLPPLGFVVALRGTIIRRSSATRREWLIASRWGDGGLYLSVARTLVPVGVEVLAPPDLVPRWSTLALLNTSSTRSNSPSFRFVDQCPVGLELAGRFAPSLGNVRVEGSDKAIRLWGSIRCLPRKSGRHLQFEGVQINWVGEFIEPRS